MFDIAKPFILGQAMLYHRQKTLLALLEALGGNQLATDFQKYLFIFSELYESDKSYDFVPYKYGCYSFQASADKKKLIEKGYLLDETAWVLAKPNFNYSSALSKNKTEKISVFVNQFSKLRGKQLITHVYKTYPYYATKSEIAADHLNSQELKKIHSARPKESNTPIFATIGYEGGSIEAYLNILIKTQIRVLVDVRKNPISRKYGFSKNILSSLLGKVGIQYMHMPELGIASADRKTLNTQRDYDRLFDRYEKSVLKHQANAIKNLYEVYRENKHIAITCFEKSHCQCHRSRVATAIEKLSQGVVIAQHI